MANSRPCERRRVRDAKAVLVGDGIHEPGGKDGHDDEKDEVADGGEETFFGSFFEDAGEDDGNE